MGMIDCKDCGTRISDAAKACPKCGAPVTPTVGTGQQQCPFCRTVMPNDAMVCRACRARKGYYATGRYGVMGKRATITVLVLAIIAAWLVVAFFWPLAILFALGAIACIYCLIRGPRWYQSRHPG